MQKIWKKGCINIQWLIRYLHSQKTDIKYRKGIDYEKGLEISVNVNRDVNLKFFIGHANGTGGHGW